MDAHALLTSQGWRGAGHSLHATTDDIGLSKPLLLNRRDGNKGLGQKAHFTSDLWWMNAFDEQLQGLSTTKTAEGKVGVVQSVTQGRINSIEKGMGGRWTLGGNFVRGGFLEGTLSVLPTPPAQESDGTSTSTSANTSSDESTPAVKDAPTETKEERRARRKAKKVEKEMKRARKEQKRARKKDMKALGKATGSLEVSKVSKKERKEETKEERRARRDAKRLKREAQKAG